MGVCHTLIPVLVASLTASSSLSYFGLNVTVKAQSMIRPANRQQKGEHLLVHVLQADLFLRGSGETILPLVKPPAAE